MPRVDGDVDSKLWKSSLSLPSCSFIINRAELGGRLAGGSSKDDMPECCLESRNCKFPRKLKHLGGVVSAIDSTVLQVSVSEILESVDENLIKFIGLRDNGSSE